MKTRKCYITMTVLLFLICICFTVYADLPVHAASISLSKTNITLKVGESKSLTVIGSKKKTKWSSSDKKIAAVSKNGKITGKKVGLVVIYCKIAGKVLKCQVTVTDRTTNTNGKNNKVICNACGGLGECHYCFGLGECENCFGLGTTTCSTCGGGGSCPSCYGTKGEYKYTVYGNKWVSCTRCNGSGNCTRCNGSGESKCTKCSGSGNCTYCHGRKTCNICKGSGYVKASNTGKSDNNKPNESDSKKSDNNKPSKSSNEKSDNNKPSKSDSEKSDTENSGTDNVTNQENDNKVIEQETSANKATVVIEGEETTFYLYSAYLSTANYLCVSFYTLQANGEKGCRLHFRIKNSKVETGINIENDCDIDYENSEMGMSIFGGASYSSNHEDCMTKEKGYSNLTFDSINDSVYKGTFNGLLFHKSCNYRYSYNGTDYKTFENGTFEFKLRGVNDVFN